MLRIIRVDIASRDCSKVVEASRTVGWAACTLIAGGACSGSIEGCKLAVGTTQEAVLHTVGVNIDSRDRSFQIEA
jgi:hypothetical protein